MTPKQLIHELRRIARQEVPKGEPDLWPAIRRRITPRRTPYSSPSSHGSYIRSETSAGSPELSSVYVWSADERHHRFGNGARLLAAGAALALVVALLAIMMGNHGENGNNQPVGAIVSPSSSGSPTAQKRAWDSTGKLTIPLEPVSGSDIHASVDAQIMPSGDLRLSTSVTNSVDIVTWHVVTQTCENVTSLREQALSDQDVVPPFQQYGRFYAFVPADTTHQPLTLVVINQTNDPPVACATIPAVPATLAVGYRPASTVPHTCPVTLPSQPTFIPPAAFPADPARPLYGDYWHGTSSLWVGLPLNGTWKQDVQIFYWSALFDPNAETRPALRISAKRLDGDSPRQLYSPQPSGADGGMLVNVTFGTPGCWQVTGTYKGHSLKFVVWVENSISPQTPAATPSTDGLTHTDQACHPSSFGPSSAHPGDTNVEFRGTASSGQFWAIVYQQLPIFAEQKVDLALKLQTSGPLILSATDANGLEITPLTGPTAAEEANWPRPGNAWISSFNFPRAGCWHIEAKAGTVTGDLWFEVVSEVGTPTPVTSARDLPRG